MQCVWRMIGTFRDMSQDVSGFAHIILIGYFLVYFVS